MVMSTLQNESASLSQHTEANAGAGGAVERFTAGNATEGADDDKATGEAAIAGTKDACCNATRGEDSLRLATYPTGSATPTLGCAGVPIGCTTGGMKPMVDGVGLLTIDVAGPAVEEVDV